MLVACEKHNTVHDLTPQEMAGLIYYYQHHWVAASYQPDALPVLSSISSEEQSLRSLCPQEDAARVAHDAEPADRAVANVRRMRDLREKFRKNR